MIYVIIALLVTIFGLWCFTIANEGKIVEKANKTDNVFNIYYILATLFSSKFNNDGTQEYEPSELNIGTVILVGIIVVFLIAIS